MYEFLLGFHNISRWLVLLAALYGLYRSWQGLRNQAYTPSDRSAAMVFVGLMDLQLLLGGLLMFLSPFMQNLWGNLGSVMQVQATRFFLAEHWVGMLLATVLAHVGSTRARRANDPRAKHWHTLLWFSLSLLLVLLSIPWWRKLLPFG
jgi:hypothetical protein